MDVTAPTFYRFTRFKPDFYVFSGHKLYDHRVLVSYMGKNILEDLDPYQTGGEMIDYVSFEKLHTLDFLTNLRQVP